jgi:hypothetical protein
LILEAVLLYYTKQQVGVIGKYIFPRKIIVGIYVYMYNQYCIG